MNVKSYLHGAEDQVRIGEFSYKDIVNGEYSFSIDLSPDNVGPIYIIGKGPLQDLRTSSNDDIDILAFVDKDSRFIGTNGVSSFRFQSSVTKGDGSVREYICGFLRSSSDVWLTKVLADGTRSNITINFKNDNYDIEGYLFRYFIIGKNECYTVRCTEKDDTEEDFKYSIANKLNGNFVQQNLVTHASVGVSTHQSPGTIEFTNNYYLNRSEYDSKKSLLMVLMDNNSWQPLAGGPGIVLCYPSWIPPLNKLANGGTSVYFLISNGYEGYSIIDTRDSNQNLIIEFPRRGSNQSGSEPYIAISNPEVPTHD